MATSPNYGWAEPDNSSLVKNGAQDIRALGNAIDTSLWNVGFGQAGKNKVINGDFRVWQRGTSFSLTGSTIYTADRWATYGVTGDTLSQQTFTPGTAPVSGYEGTFYARLVTGATASPRYFYQKIEDVRTFAGQTVTLSFWARVSAGTGTVDATLGNQNFGSGGSAFVGGTGQSFTATTSWQRFSFSGTVASIAGKTIGTGSFAEATLSTSNTSKTFEFWGVQLEAGSVATPFQTATGTIQGEISATKRYTKTTLTGGNPLVFAMSSLTSFGNSYSGTVFFDTPLRVSPTMTFQDSAGNVGKVTMFNAAGTQTNNITPTFSYVTDGTSAIIGFRISVSGAYVYSEMYAITMNSEL